MALYVLPLERLGLSLYPKQDSHIAKEASGRDGGHSVPSLGVGCRSSHPGTALCLRITEDVGRSLQI